MGEGWLKEKYNCIHLVKEDAFLQRFLLCNLDQTKSPDTYQVIVDNIGVKPAGVIATLALQKSADKYGDQFPATARQLRYHSHVNNIGLMGKNGTELQRRTGELRSF